MRNCAAIFLLGIWLTLGAWFYVCKVKKLCPNSSTIQTTKTVTDRSGKEEVNLSPTDLKNAYLQIFQIEEDVVFQPSEAELKTGELFELGLDSVAHFLNKYPDTKLTITGHYSEDEENPTSFSNLGLARADGIKQQLLDKGVGEQQLITVAQEGDLFGEALSSPSLIDFKFSKRYAYLNETDVKKAYKAIDFLEHYSQFFKDGNEVLFSEEPNFHIEQVSYYLNRNKEHLLRIKVPYQEDEQNVVDTLDIGLVRALDLKHQLAEIAIAEEAITIQSNQEIDIFDNSDFSYPKVIDYNFVFPDLNDTDLEKELALERALSRALSREVADSDSQVEEEEETIENEPVSPTDEVVAAASPLQFHTGSHTLTLTNSVNDYIQDLKSYLNENPGRKVLVIGHTDNVGDPEYNIELGRLRGYEARRLLINNQISPSRINVISEGQYRPIASNENADGRRLNRRVDIDIQ